MVQEPTAMPSNTTETIPLPVRVHRLRLARKVAQEWCSTVCADPESTPRQREAAVKIRDQLVEEFHMWRDMLEEMV